MSSADSRTTSSSRLSQFGIYRSIDARTEEFLRLSRKRQIRQGCACAAVSTAITVTIVITVLLVYEYTMNLDSNPTLKSRLAAWHGIFNESSPFEVKYSKSKANIDPTTLKLLPLVFKALNQNRNVENTIPGPVTETRKDVIKQSYKNNLFHGSKQTQNSYKSDFKSPAVGYKNTFNNLDYYKKIRQTNDHNRMLNYFDKMINVNALDSSIFSSEESKDETSTERSTQTSVLSEKHKHKKSLNGTTKLRHGENKTKISPRYTTRQPKSSYQRSKITPSLKAETVLNFDKLIKRKNYKKSHNRNQRLSLMDIVVPFETTTTKTTKHCNCSKKLADMLLRFFTDIQNILPEIKFYKTTCGIDIKKPTSIVHTTTLSTTSLPARKIATSSIKLNSKDVQPSNFNERSILSQTIIKNSWLPIDFDLKSNFSNIQNKTDRIKITTMRATAEPTYTTPFFEGFNTEPISKTKSRKIWRPKMKSEGKEVHNHKTFISTITKTPPFLDDPDKYLYFANSEVPLHKVSDFQSSVESKRRLNFVTKSEENILPHNLNNVYTVPSLDQTETKKELQIMQKENTTSIIKLFNAIKINKVENIFHSKRTNQSKSEIITNPKEHITEYTIKNISGIEPKINGQLNVSNEIVEYNKNDSLNEKRIHPIWPEQNYKNKYDVTSGMFKSPNASISPSISVTKANSNLSAHENTKDIIKRADPIQRKYNSSVNSEQRESQVADSNNILKTNETNTSSFNGTKKKNINLLPSASQTFFSKYAEINNLLYQTKNISNVTIYEKFNFGQFADDLNTVAALEYDEFKFLNDEILESEKPEVEHSETDKYAINSQKQQRDNSDETKFIKSMIPVSRPVFLEIQRSDWKHDSDVVEQDDGTSENNFE